MSERSAPVERGDRRPITARLRPALAALRFRDAVFLTILPLAAIVLLFGSSVFDYARVRHFDDWWSRQQSVAQFFSARVHALATLPATLALRHRFEPEGGESGVLRLTVEGREWDAMHTDPLRMWGEWVDARLEYGSTSIDARVRKRGDNSLHWLTDKRSLAVRTRQEEFYKRFRSFGLSVKDVVPSFLANRLATEFGILAPHTEVVAVYLNNRFFGTYRFVELPDESFLRLQERMPGNIYRADRAERSEVFKGVPRSVFHNPALWDRTAVNDRWTAAAPDQIRLLIDDVNGTTFEDHRRLLRRVDAADFARLFAYLFLTGDPYHMDQMHNQLLYEDPSTQRLHPIPWDIRLLDLRGPALPVNELFTAMLRDPYLVDDMVREIGARVADDRLLDLADSLVRDVEHRLGPYLEYDRGREGLVPTVGSANASMSVLRRNVVELRAWMRDDTVAVHAARAGAVVLVDLEARGRVGADLVALEVEGTLSSAPVLRLDRNRNGRLDPDDPPVPVRLERATGITRLTLAQPVALLTSWSTEAPGIGPGHTPYRVFLEGMPEGALPTPLLMNRVDRSAAAQVPWDAASFVRHPSGWHPWQYPEERGRAIRFAGTVRLDTTLMVGRRDTLLVAPGTTVLLGPDVSIVSRGRVIAEGTEARPIRFLPQQHGRPWGAFALQEHGADSSVMRWTEFVQGGGALIDRIEYTGMVNVHRADAVVFDRVSFRENLHSEDTFRALHSHVDLTNSTFIGANSDAVAYDVATGEIRGNTFDGSGGDAIDLMASRPRIIGNIIRGSAEKGISIGDASRPFIFDNRIEGCTIGLEVKDRSEAVILHNDIVGNGTGLRVRRENWRYGGGGWATIVNTAFRDNRTAHARDSLSRLTAFDAGGLGDRDSNDPAIDLGWLYSRWGVRPVATGPGRPSAWSSIPAAPPLAEYRFVDDFGPTTDGWVAAGGTTRLEKRRDALRMHVESNPGDASRTVDWSLPRGGTLVLEVADRDLAVARVTAFTSSDSVTVPLRLTNNLLAFDLLAVPLPPGHYRGIRLAAEPREGLSHSISPDGLFALRSGRLELRSVAVYDSPAPAIASRNRSSP
jgi:hypothetical protein